ncbi:YunG family protein [Lysobacter sp. 22409]|uniref:YunG family protein n=1 Tax=Lysobacter sp. 22409 TaxID=3453917 RepID=UPI003F85498E
MNQDLFLSNEEFVGMLRQLRTQLEKGFSAETSLPGHTPGRLSAGQCAAVALVMHELLGGQLVSATVEGVSHWFNRLQTGNGQIDVDTTADQFGLPPIRISRAGELYPGTRLRNDSEVRDETRRRSNLLKRKALAEGVTLHVLRDIVERAMERR